MRFTKQHKVIIASMNKVEAKAFIKFLHSEVLRHAEDIQNADNLIIKLRERFKI